MKVTEKENKAFGDRLADVVRQRNSVVCVGLDPRWELLPERMTAGVAADDWDTKARVIGRFCCEVIDAVEPYVAVAKPQAAFFELFGPPGMQALSGVIQHCRRKGVPVILDGKRGDIGSTAKGYAAAYLGAQSPWQADALTVNPYLGDDTLAPFVEQARDTGTGIFVLVKTSNPGSGFLQDVLVDGAPLYRRVAHLVARLGAENADPASGWHFVGAVVGATYPQQLAELRELMPRNWFLIPGYGAQGATAGDVAAGFNDQGLGALVNSSRGIIFAFRRGEAHRSDWQDAVRDAAEQMQTALNACRSGK